MERIILYNLTYMMRMVDLVAIVVKTIRIHNQQSSEKELTKLILIDPCEFLNNIIPNFLLS